MTATMRRILFWAIPLTALAVVMAYLFSPRPVAVDLATASRAQMTVTVAEEGVTRIRDVFVVSAPIPGRAMRIDLEEGDTVIAGETVVAEIEPVSPAFLDVRSEAEARAAVATSESALALAHAQLEQAEAELRFAEAERERQRTLRRTNTVSARALEDAERVFETRAADVETRRAGVQMRESELMAARVRLLRPAATDRGGACPCLKVTAPVDGKVLRVLHESEGVVAAGAPLIEIGDPDDLEIVADFLSSDAVRIAPGQRAVLDAWGGTDALNGTVMRIEPYGFTKVSALGIEEQRVDVRVNLTDPRPVWQRLGHGFKTDVRIVLWEGDNVLQVPLTALFRDGADWQVFVEEDGRATPRTVRIGRRTDMTAEILEGLEPGARIVRYPSDFIRPGDLIVQR